MSTAAAKPKASPAPESTSPPTATAQTPDQKLDLLADALADRLGLAEIAARIEQLERAIHALPDLLLEQEADRRQQGEAPIPAKLTPEEMKRFGAWLAENVDSGQIGRVGRKRSLQRWRRGESRTALRETAEKALAELGFPGALDALIADDTPEPVSQP